MGLPASVAPFIFGGVCLYGIDSVMCPLPRRQETWKRQATDLDRQKLATLTREIDFPGCRKQRLRSWPARSAAES